MEVPENEGRCRISNGNRTN